MVITETRHARLMALLNEFGSVGGFAMGYNTAFAQKLGISLKHFSNIKGKRSNIGHNMARKFEVSLGLKVGALDQPIAVNDEFIERCKQWHKTTNKATMKHQWEFIDVTSKEDPIIVKIAVENLRRSLGGCDEPI
jgi:hypothetical protein